VLRNRAQPQDRLHHRDQRQDPQHQVLQQIAARGEKNQGHDVKRDDSVAVVARVIPQLL
jgi:hypothetical protein